MSIKPDNNTGAAQPVTPASQRTGWHALSVSQTVAELGTDADRGLGAEEAERRLEEHGPNQLAQDRRWSRAKRLGAQFNDALIWLLLAAAAVSALVLGAWFDASAIAAIVILNAAIGYAQESKADRALAGLRDLEAPEATIVRGGRTSRIDARALVPGDLIHIEAGDQVPADARLVQTARLVANEAALTGESIPVSKTTTPVGPEAGVGDRKSMVWAGTTAVSGRGRAVVTGTGAGTEMGRIAALFGDEQPITPLQVELGRVGRRLGVIAVSAAALIFGAGLIRSFPVETMALTAVALAVAAIPEGLPAVVTVSLAGGLQRMAQRNAVVRRLPAVETLGAVDVICTDKTGTLTAAELKVGAVALPDGREGPESLETDHRAARSLAATAALCNDAYRSTEGLDGDPTEIALLKALQEARIDFDEVREAHERVDEAAFDGGRKAMSTLHAEGDGYVLRVKGAPETLLEKSTAMAAADGDRPLTDGERRRLLEKAEQLAASGMRTLAFASRALESRPENPIDEERDLRFDGMVGLNERVRAEAPDAIRRAAEAGVTTVMVTGDHLTTAAAVGEAVGLEPGEKMSGRDLSAVGADELARSIRGYRVFARVDPADKVKIIEAWKGAGATVAMTGDGVNDAPALHRADIGVAMGSGTDVARESAAMVLADDNYATIVSAIAEGRRLFSNLRNVVHYLLSANASEVIYVLAGFLIFGHLGEPILAIQLLWINLMSDALPAIALGAGAEARDLMKDRPGEGRNVLSARNLTVLLGQGTILASAAMAAMLIGAHALSLDPEAVRTMVFSTLVFSQLLHSLSVRAGSGPMRRPGRFLAGSILGSAAMQFVIVYSPIGARIFHTQPLGADAMMWAVAASAASMAAVRALNVTLGRLRAKPLPEVKP